jgi:hypothetical protein
MIDGNSTKAEVLKAVKRDGYALKFASEELRNDKEVVIAAVGYKGTFLRHGRALKYASEELRNDIDVVRAALSQSWDAVNYASRQIQRKIIQDWLGIKEVKND